MKFTWYNYKTRVWRGKPISPIQAEILFLLFSRGGLVPMSDIIEFVYPNPDNEPIDAKGVLRVIVYKIRNKFDRSTIKSNHGWGYSV